MSHFAEIDENGIVKRVIVAEQDFIDSGAVGDRKNWIQTSYSATFRKNYAGVGYLYDKNRDAFIPPKNFDSWILDQKTCNWVPPKEKPKDGKLHRWNEAKKDWEEDNALTNIRNGL